MKIKNLKFEVDGSTIFVLNKNGHNLFALKVETGCNCPSCSENSDTNSIARQVTGILNDE